MIDLHPEHLKRPAFVALSRLLQTGHEITIGNFEEVDDIPPLEKKATASSAVFLILKN